jgi:adenosine deaminase
MSQPLEEFIRQVPKAELHLHIEGTLEPELMFALGQRNRLPLRFGSPEEARRAYAFQDLQSFLDLYYEGTRVLVQEEDFHDLTWAYLQRAAHERIRHAEIFFDPQSHTARGVPFATVVTGIHRALRRAERELGVSSRLIMCFLRHLSAESAMRTLTEALPFQDWIVGVGLDSAERDHPPTRFTEAYARARAAGFLAVAHAGEEGPPAYIEQALDLLGVVRIDHGVRCVEDPRLVERLQREQVPLTVCPLSNVRLRVFDRLEAHNLKHLLDLGLRVTVNSDDPAYFGGYLTENLLAVQRALGLGRADIQRLARNGFAASFLPEADRQRWIRDVDATAERFSAGG